MAVFEEHRPLHGVDIGAGREQNTDRLGVAIPGREDQRCPRANGGCLGVRPVFQQQANRVRVATVGRHVQRGDPLFGLRVHIDALAQVQSGR
jgi:hypothetical protein